CLVATESGTASRGRTAGQKRAAVVYNPVKVELRRLRRVVDRVEAECGWGRTRWSATSEEDAGQSVTREAIEAGADVVLAAGGDGTVRAVAEALRGSGIPLALLPAGTGNLFARNLELTLGDLEASVRTAFSGADRTVDLGIAEITREDGSTSG